MEPQTTTPLSRHLGIHNNNKKGLRSNSGNSRGSNSSRNKQSSHNVVEVVKTKGGSKGKRMSSSSGPQQPLSPEEESSQNSSVSTEVVTATTTGTSNGSSSSCSPLLTERAAYDFVWNYMDQFTETASYCNGTGSSLEAWSAFWNDYHTPDYLLVRPSGNTLDQVGLRTMFESGDIVNFSDQVVMVESVQVFGNGVVAVVIFKSQQEFIYKGCKEEDFCTWTAVIVPHQGRLKLSNIQRSSGKRINAVYSNTTKNQASIDKEEDAQVEENQDENANNA